MDGSEGPLTPHFIRAPVVAFRRHLFPKQAHLDQKVRTGPGRSKKSAQRSDIPVVHPHTQASVNDSKMILPGDKAVAGHRKEIVYVRFPRSRSRRNWT